MTKRSLPTPEQLRELLTYDPETGKLFWKFRPVDFFKTEKDFKIWNKKFSGKEAFTSNVAGYKTGSVLCVYLRAHRVIWAMHYGAWPADQIDHINMRRSDNRICNLREASPVDNLRNKKRYSNNSSGFKGVSLHKETGKWRARIHTGKHHRSLGLFFTPEEASSAYAEAAKMHHGEFARF